MRRREFVTLLGGSVSCVAGLRRVNRAAGNGTVPTRKSRRCAFPAGRYSLVLKGQAFDFTVSGPITDPAHCLERTEAANGAYYSECQNP